MRMLLLGAPGAGKGTQAQLIAEAFNLPHLSTGDMFRSEIEAQSDVGIKAKAYMDRGDLVPDEVTIEIVNQRLKKADCAAGFILDGFPRTLEQAKALDNLLQMHHVALDVVFSFEVNEEEIIRRRAGRRTAPKSKRVYHVEFNPPKTPGKCDVSGEDLVQRDDDKEDVVRHRLKVYAEQTAPLQQYYAERGLVVQVNGMQPVKQVFADVKAELQRRQS